MKDKLPSADRIRHAAKDLFATNGFHQTSMSELAAAADMSVGLIYRSFKSKAEIIEAIVHADFDEKIADLERIRQRLGTGEITIEKSIEELFLHAMRDSDEALSFDILAEGSRNERVGQTIGKMCERLRSYLRGFALAANPSLAGDQLEGAAELMLGCMFGLGHRRLAMPRLDASQTAEQSARMMVAALRAL
ncbi:TetR/AcrR family transcriptional repressor of uid operon [Sphingobium fontiphilum]|uniref:TetR/AcrR family transcriptional repressor of uid operon n=1 Tax=Sphingobium fontiphilum TaxID=944425 RepID=A0A7W6GP09_9SPHN|nr:TetR/AcrR family transcriptional repressor of uid operon [Sphingobium fontiphilum]